MSVERVFHCDGPDCDRHVRTVQDRPEMFLTVASLDEGEMHFCGWDCVLRFAGTKEPEVLIPGSSADAI